MTRVKHRLQKRAFHAGEKRSNIPISIWGGPYHGTGGERPESSKGGEGRGESMTGQEVASRKKEKGKASAFKTGHVRGLGRETDKDTSGHAQVRDAGEAAAKTYGGKKFD